MWQWWQQALGQEKVSCSKTVCSHVLQSTTGKVCLDMDKYYVNHLVLVIAVCKQAISQNSSWVSNPTFWPKWTQSIYIFFLCTFTFSIITVLQLKTKSPICNTVLAPGFNSGSLIQLGKLDRMRCWPNRLMNQFSSDSKWIWKMLYTSTQNAYKLYLNIFTFDVS